MAIPQDKLFRLRRMSKVQISPRVHLELPQERGIYVVFTVEGEVLYVGKAENFRRRWRTHHRLKSFLEGPITVLAWETIPPEVNLAKEESRWILELNPRDNGSQSGQFHQSVRVKNITDTRRWGEE